MLSLYLVLQCSQWIVDLNMKKKKNNWQLFNQIQRTEENKTSFSRCPTIFDHIRSLMARSKPLPTLLEFCFSPAFQAQLSSYCCPGLYFDFQLSYFTIHYPSSILFKKIPSLEQGMCACTVNPSTQKVETDGFPRVFSHPGLCMRLCLKTVLDETISTSEDQS